MGEALRFSARLVADQDYDGLYVSEILLRFPRDAKPGGELMVRRLKAGQVVGEPVHVVLEPGEPDDLKAKAWRPWLLGILHARNLIPDPTDVTVEETPDFDDAALGRFPRGGPSTEPPLLRL